MKFIKENMRLLIAMIIALVLIVSGVVFLSIDKDNKPNKPIEKPTNIHLNDATNFSEEDAIEIVKENFASDNYEFEAVDTKDGLYKVIVKNTATNSEIIYYVDPTTGNAYIDLGTK